MKRKLFSLVLVLVMIACAVPCAFTVGATETSSDWTAVNFDYLTKTDDGFTIAADGATGREIAMWNGLLYEGKFSVDIKTSAITGGSGEMPGIFFGGKGIETVTATAVAPATASYYRAYFDGKGQKLVIGAVHEGTWVSGFGTGRNVDLKAKFGDEKWAEVFAADTVKLTVAYSQSGAAAFWINDIEVLKVSDGSDFKVNDNLTVRKDCVPYGGQIAYDNGSAAVAGGVSNFKILGGLELKVVQGTATYDAKTYTLATEDGATLAYFSNRDIKDGSIKSTFPVVNNNDGQSGVVIGLYDNGSETREGANIAYYMLQLRSTNQFRWCMSNGAVATEEMKALEGNDRMNATNAYIDSRVTGYDFNTNSGPACNWFFGGNKSITDLDNIVASFKITGDSAAIDSSAINEEVGAFVDSKPFDGGFYGIRTDKGTTVSVYAINNVKEAIALELVSADNDLEAGEEGTAVVKTFPAGSVINSGDKLVISGSGIQQTGDAIDNGDGTYTIKYTATGAPGGTASISVDNHIFGTLAVDVDIAVTGTASQPGDDNTPGTGDNNPGTGDATPDAGDNAPADDKKDEEPSNAIVWIIVAVAAVAVVAIAVVVIIKKKK